jgi:hypothetical protein
MAAKELAIEQVSRSEGQGSAHYSQAHVPRSDKGRMFFEVASLPDPRKLKQLHAVE